MRLKAELSQFCDTTFLSMWQQEQQPRPMASLGQPHQVSWCVQEQHVQRCRSTSPGRACVGNAQRPTGMRRLVQLRAFSVVMPPTAHHVMPNQMRRDWWDVPPCAPGAPGNEVNQRTRLGPPGAHVICQVGGAYGTTDLPCETGMKRMVHHQLACELWFYDNQNVLANGKKCREKRP